MPRQAPGTRAAVDWWCARRRGRVCGAADQLAQARDRASRGRTVAPVTKGPRERAGASKPSAAAPCFQHRTAALLSLAGRWAGRAVPSRTADRLLAPFAYPDEWPCLVHVCRRACCNEWPRGRLPCDWSRGDARTLEAVAAHSLSCCLCCRRSQPRGASSACASLPRSPQDPSRRWRPIRSLIRRPSGAGTDGRIVPAPAPR